MNMRFGPFGKPLKSVTEADLDVLKTIAEGWYTEYKGEKPSPKKISKAVSSFANSYGGLYFIGIEGDKTTNCAKSMPGVNDSPDVVRDSVRGNIQPFPYFETLTIPLSNGRKVIMVCIHEGENPPYIMSDGRIYRRQEAASDPIYETDRHVVDMLYSKSRDYEDMIEQFRKIDYSFYRAEENVPHLQIFVNPRPFNHHRIEDLLGEGTRSALLEKFNEAYNLKNADPAISVSGQIPFDTLSTYHNSIAIRNLNGWDLTYNGLSVEIDIYGNAKILIPLNQVLFDRDEFDDSYIKVIKRSKDRSEGCIRFLDGKAIFYLITGLLSKYSSFILENDYDGDVEIKLRLSNCHRTSLYFSKETFIKHVQEYGLPICMKDEQYFPTKALEMKIKDLESNPISESGIAFAFTALALGIPSEIAIRSLD